MILITACASKFLSNPIWGFLGAFGALGCLVGVLYAVRQLRLSAWANAQDIFTDQSFVDARTAVLGHFEDEGYEPTLDDQTNGLLVCRRMDKLACLADQGIMKKNKILEHWRNPIGKCWIIVERRWHIITQERETCGWDKWSAFDKLGREAAQQLP